MMLCGFLGDETSAWRRDIGFAWIGEDGAILGYDSDANFVSTSLDAESQELELFHINITVNIQMSAESTIYAWGSDEEG